MNIKPGKVVVRKKEIEMKEEKYRPHDNPNKKHGRLPLKKSPAKKAVTKPVKLETFVNISQEQKHGRGPRR
jgi:hypothetical protein